MQFSPPSYHFIPGTPCRQTTLGDNLGENIRYGIFVLLSINVTHSLFIFYYSSTCFGLTRLSSSVIVYSPEAGALLCQFFAYVRVPAMCFCWWCAYCQCPCVRIFVLSLWPPCCLFLVVTHLSSSNWTVCSPAAVSVIKWATTSQTSPRVFYFHLNGLVSVAYSRSEVIPNLQILRDICRFLRRMSILTEGCNIHRIETRINVDRYATSGIQTHDLSA
jgi:hypothetical protein